MALAVEVLELEVELEALPVEMALAEELIIVKCINIFHKVPSLNSF